MAALRPLRAACLLALACLGACAAAGAATIKTTTYSDKPAGFEITLPTDWHYVPSTVAQVKAKITQLEREKQTKLASVYELAISSASARSALTEFSFDAFLFPPIGSMQTQILIGIVRTTTPYTRASLPAVGQAFAKTFAATAGTKVAKPRIVSLPAGPAAYLEGTDKGSLGGATGGFELYLIPHGKLLYELSFHTEASVMPKATVFTAIARSFAFI